MPDALVPLRTKRAQRVSLSPFGLGFQKPRHFMEMLRIAWENRDQLGYAYRVLTQGVCDGCALGTSGLRDWTLDGAHLCLVRLNLLRDTLRERSRRPGSSGWRTRWLRTVCATAAQHCYRPAARCRSDWRTW